MTKLNTWPCIRRISVKHIPDFSEYVLPLLKKKSLNSLALFQSRPPTPRQSQKHPLKEIGLLHISTNLLATFSSPATPFDCPKAGLVLPHCRTLRRVDLFTL